MTKAQKSDKKRTVLETFGIFDLRSCGRTWKDESHAKLNYILTKETDMIIFIILLCLIMAGLILFGLFISLLPYLLLGVAVGGIIWLIVSMIK